MAKVWPCTNAQYHADTSRIGSTMLKTILDPGPSTYYGRFVGTKPDGTPLLPFEPTDDMILGSAVHCLVFEPTNFDAMFCTRPDGIDGRTKDGKEKLAAFRQASLGKTELTTGALAKARAMAASVLAEPTLQKLLNDSRETAIERAIVWTEQGIEMKCRPDWFLYFDDSNFDLHLDLKTSSDPLPTNWLSSSQFGPMAKYRYDLQVAAHYPIGIESLTGRACASGVVVVGKTEPYDVFLYNTSSWGPCGEAWRQKAINALLRCRETDVWRDEAQDHVSVMQPPSDWTFPRE